MSKLELVTTEAPFPWTALLLATHSGIAVDYTTGKVAYGSIVGAEAIEKELAGSLKGKEVALPTLPTAFTPKTGFGELVPIFNTLDDYLALRTYFSGRVLGYNDLHFWGLIKSSQPAIGVLKQNKHVHLQRWYFHIDSLEPTQAAIKGLTDAKSDQARNKKVAQTEGAAGSLDVKLPNAVEGKVVVRFAPEPSGYLHIGHLKPAVLNRYLADKYKGKFILRFDDTNPDKEEDEFEGSFKGDLELLGIKWDNVVHTSDHFGKIQELARMMVEEGTAYMDDTDQMTMRQERMDLIASKNRDASVADNLTRFDEMVKGSEVGQKWFLRAKMEYKSPNGAMRDPAIFRCVNKAHHVTGDKYKAYPTYDLACPIVDSLDGVTHALRANEYADRKPQYEWFLKALHLPHIEIFDFSRIDFVYTLLSKRKLKSLVEQGRVAGWEDPRFATIRGMRARGMTFEALKGFILSQGASSATLLMEWDQIWSGNKRVIDPIAPRYWAVSEDDIVKVKIVDGPEKVYTEKQPLHKKNPAVGDKDMVFSSDLIIEQEDAASFGDTEEITLMSWGNAIVKSKSLNAAGKVESITMGLHLEGDFKKTSKKVHWLSEDASASLIPVTLIDYDYLINKKKIEADDDFNACLNPVTEYRTKALADKNIAGLKQHDIIQFERKGFYIYQGTKDSEGRMEFGFIPDGKVSSVALKGPAFGEATTAAVGAEGTKGWGKTSGATAAKVPKGVDPTPEIKSGKSFLSDVERGFTITSSDTMYSIGRVYGDKEVITPAESVNMYTLKPVYEK